MAGNRRIPFLAVHGVEGHRRGRHAGDPADQPVEAGLAQVADVGIEVGRRERIDLDLDRLQPELLQGGARRRGRLLAERGVLLQDADLLQLQVLDQVADRDLALLVGVEGALVVIRILRAVAQLGAVGVGRLDDLGGRRGRDRRQRLRAAGRAGDEADARALQLLDDRGLLGGRGFVVFLDAGNRPAEDAAGGVDLFDRDQAADIEVGKGRGETAGGRPYPADVERICGVGRRRQTQARQAEGADTQPPCGTQEVAPIDAAVALQAEGRLLAVRHDVSSRILRCSSNASTQHGDRHERRKR